MSKVTGFICTVCKQSDAIEEDLHGKWCGNCGPSAPRPVPVQSHEGMMIWKKDYGDDTPGFNRPLKKRAT